MNRTLVASALSALAFLMGAQTAAAQTDAQQQDYYCVARALPKFKIEQAGAMILDDADKALREIAQLTADERADCAKRLKWDDQQAMFAAVAAAGGSGMLSAEADLKPRYDRAALDAIQARLTADDRLALSLFGVRKLTAAKEAAFDKRFEAFLASTGADQSDRNAIADWLTSSVRYDEAEAAYFARLGVKL